MSEKEKDKKKEALKEFRKKRSKIIELVRKTNKVQKNDIKSISEQLQTGGKTVPEIAAAANMPASQVLLYVASLMEYGIVAEGDKEGDYFKYELKAK